MAKWVGYEYKKEKKRQTMEKDKKKGKKEGS